MFAGKVSWGAVFEGQQSGNTLAVEIHEWLTRLSELRLPAVGELLEVELAVKPPAKLCVPPPRRFPVAEVPIHQLFDLLSIETVLKVLKLLLCEEKVRARMHTRMHTHTCLCTHTHTHCHSQQHHSHCLSYDVGACIYMYPYHSTPTVCMYLVYCRC